MDKNNFSHVVVSIFRKAVIVLSGLILSLVLLEAGLRLGGFIFSSIQEYENLRSIKQKSAFRILCIGESTTQGQYPHLLEKVLNQRNIGVHFSVIDKGRAGTNSITLLEEIESNLVEYHPDMVVAMMGINDQGIYYQDMSESHTWIFRHCRVYRLGRIFMYLLKNFREKNIDASDRADWERKPLRNDKGTAIEKANLSNETSTEKVDQLDLKDAEKTPGPASSYLNGHELSRAKDFFGKAILLDPENEKAYAELEKLYQLQGEVFQAEDFFKKIIELDPKNDRAYVGLGRFYLLQKKFFQAEDSFKKAIELNPENAIAYVGLGGRYQELGELSQAEGSFKKAIAINPRSDKAYDRLGWLYLYHGKFSKAEDPLKKAIAINPENDHAYVGLGRSYEERFKFSQAEDWYRKAIEINPAYVKAYVKLGWLYQHQGKFLQAEGSFKKVLEINPRNGDAYFTLGQIYRNQGNLSQAEDSFRRAIEINPKHKRLLGEMSLLYEKMGKPELAKDYAEKARLLLKSGDYAVTVSSYRKLKEILDRKGIILVCVQYPVRNVAPLKKIFEKDRGVIFVDNEQVFKEAVKRSGFKEYFTDIFAGDFGHCTQKGNELLAQNIADVILKEVFNR